MLDADALTLLAQDKALFGLLHENCVLSPHEGEFARLFPDIYAQLTAPATKGPAYSKVDAARAAAKRAGCVVVFKGADTVIAAPDGRCAVHSAHYERAAAWLVISCDAQMFDIALEHADHVCAALGAEAEAPGSDPLGALVRNLDKLFRKSAR